MDHLKENWPDRRRAQVALRQLDAVAKCHDGETGWGGAVGMVSYYTTCFVVSKALHCIGKTCCVRANILVVLIPPSRTIRGP